MRYSLQELGLEFCTFNLHTLVCMLMRQAEARGDTRRNLELHVERGIRDMKRRTKFRSTSKPECVIANGIELSNKMQLLQQQHHVHSFSSLMSRDASEGSSSNSSSSSKKLDSKQSADPDGSFLLDTGVLLQGEEKQSAIDIVCREFCRGSEGVSLWSGWSAEELQGSVVHVHARASLEDEEILSSRAYGRAKSKDSAHVFVRYEYDDEHTQDHVGVIVKFLRFQQRHEDGMPSLRPLRVALIDFYEYVKPVLDSVGDVDEDWGPVHKVLLGEGGQPRVDEASFPCKIADIKGKLVYADGVAGVGPQKGQRVRYLTTYNHLSGLL